MTIQRLSSVDIRDAVRRIVLTCDTPTLERILSNEGVYLGFQDDLNQYTGEDRHIRLAEIVVRIMGDNLLRVKTIRDSLSQANDWNLSSWRPGTVKAVDFCEHVNLPFTYAGILPTFKPRASQKLMLHDNLPPLADFQVEVLERATAKIIDSSILISLPTGAGKTRVGTTMLKKWHDQQPLGATSLWIAHTEELCEQALTCISQTWRSEKTGKPATLLRSWGQFLKQHLDRVKFDNCEISGGKVPQFVIVATPQSTAKILSEVNTGTLGIAMQNLGYVVVDEAHRAGAPVYTNLIERIKKIKPAIKLLGLSATPVRETYRSNPYKGTERLVKLFNTLIEPISTLSVDESSVAQLQEKGVLAKLCVDNLEWRPRQGRRSLYRAIANQISENRRTALLFAETVAEARIACAYLNEEGVRADIVSANSSSSERESMIYGIKSGSIQVLCNCQILTTGFDAPNISLIFMLRSTNSPVLYKQIIGRGLRGPAFGGSEFCNLYLCGFKLPFDPDPNTDKFARFAWSKEN